MKTRLRAFLIVLAANVTCCTKAVPAEVPLDAPPPPSSNAPSAIFSNTSYVEAMAAHGNTLWVATRGGLEEYDLALRTRTHTYSTRDGLPSLLIESVAVAAKGLPTFTTTRHQCTMHGPSRRFSCISRQSNGPSARSSSGGRVEGVPVNARWTGDDGTEWLGTAGLGLWVRSRGVLRRLTPTDQIASNHVVAISEWNQSSWFATFDGGLSRLRDGRFTQVPLGPQMLNDVVGTDTGLFVATTEGLYVSYDGEAFRREPRVTERFINDLAYDSRRHVLYATATNSLWEFSLDEPRAVPRVVYQPGGARSLQAVDISPEGTLFLASEDRGVLRREGRKRFVGFDRLAGYPSSWVIDVLALGGKSALAGSLHHGVFPVDGKSPITAEIDPWILFLGRDARDPETIFVGTQGGAFLVEAEGPRALVGLPNPCVHTIARLSSGLWVGTEGGLAQYR